MPFLPGFHPQAMRRKPRSAQQKLAEKMALLKQKSFKQIGELFEKFGSSAESVGSDRCDRHVVRLGITPERV
jgi:hypothetical protein